MATIDDDFADFETNKHKTRNTCFNWSIICSLLIGWPILILWIMILTVKPCPEYIKSIEKLDLDKYAGTWHEMYRSIDTPSEGGECHTARYQVRTGYIRATVFDLFGKKGMQTHRTRNGKLEIGEDVVDHSGNMTI